MPSELKLDNMKNDRFKKQTNKDKTIKLASGWTLNV